MESSNSYVLNKALKQCVCVCVCVYVEGGGACVTVYVCARVCKVGGVVQLKQFNFEVAFISLHI